jgi:hypothetical protein
MLGRFTLIALLASVFVVSVQAASADPVNAKKGEFVTLDCGGTQVVVALNGNGAFTPGHVVGSTAVLIPTAFDIAFSFTPTGAPTQSGTDTSAKAHQPSNAITCDIPVELNTETTPDGTFTLSGTVTGFFTPATE